MWSWLRRDRQDRSAAHPAEPTEADQMLAESQRTLAKVDRAAERRAPIFAEAAGHVAQNGIAADVQRSWKMKGTAA